MLDNQEDIQIDKLPEICSTSYSKIKTILDSVRIDEDVYNVFKKVNSQYKNFMDVESVKKSILNLKTKENGRI
jgi:hypothetical protein